MSLAATMIERIHALPGEPGYAHFRTARLAFHGTCEPISGALRPGGDGVFWLGETPSVAEAYIPLAGAAALLAKPLDYRLPERIRPNRHDIWAEIMYQMGHWPREVEYDGAAQATSWTVDPGHPTYADALRFVTELGYDLDGDSADRPSAWVTISIVDGRNRILPADWQTPGTTYVTLLDGLDIVDMKDTLGSDLTDPGHRQLDLFRRLENAGRDGLMIDDFAQCGRDHVNVGHPSIGLFAGALEKLTFLSYPSAHFDLSARRTTATPAFAAFRAGLVRGQHDGEAQRERA